MSRFAIAVVTLLVAGCQGAPKSPSSSGEGGTPTAIASAFNGSSGRWVDLTHAFSSSSVYWPTDTVGFRLEELAYGHTEGGWFYSSYRYSGAEHGGTHLDAPIHFAEGRQTNDQIPLSSLIGPAVVVDAPDSAGADYQLGIDDLTRWEGEHGRIPDGAILLARTGWDSRYADRAAYLGTALTGPAAIADLHFPGLAPDAASWLVANRRIAAFGIDTPSVDYGQSKDFGTHVALYAANIPGFENVANLGELPPSGSFIVALPMKIEGGSGGPLRIVAYVP
jgi:kynurenine formamidase